jgi:glycine cleavage system H protein
MNVRFSRPILSSPTGEWRWILFFKPSGIVHIPQSTAVENKEIKMPEYLETVVDKFTFKVATDRLYNAEGIWAKAEGKLVRVGLSDFVQQRSGDVAFAEVKSVGGAVTFDDEVAVIETIKVNISLGSPVTGKVVEVNPAMSTKPEAINQDPYETGWLAVIEATDWESDRSRLLKPQAYFEKMKLEAEQEVKKG